MTIARIRFTCVRCGAMGFRPRRPGRPRLYCPPCRAAKTKEENREGIARYRERERAARLEAEAVWREEERAYLADCR